MPKYKARDYEVTAFKHDGTDESALKLQAWVNSNGGKAEAFLKGDVSFDANNAYLRLENKRDQKIVPPGSWIVRLDNGDFYTMLDDAFEIIYQFVANGEPVSQED